MAQEDWRPSAPPVILKLRATLLARMRRFFEAHAVMEVDTPVLSHAASTDPALHSFITRYEGPGAARGMQLYLHTSPEFPMKRLLAAGSGPIYQLCKVFRNGEQGACHNPEFTLLEWYRTGFDHLDLMDEVEHLLREVLDGIMPLEHVQHWCYRDLFLDITGIDPMRATTAELAALLETGDGHGVMGLSAGDRDAWLDLVMTRLVEPRLGSGLVFIRDYPASQAALARLRAGNPPVASRFEAYLNGVELANGFHELADAGEQARRFAGEQAARSQQGLAAVPRDERLLAALEAGLPNCAGVALGVDRLLMLASGAGSLEEVMAFPFENA